MSQVRAGAAFVELTLKNSALVKGLRSAQKQLSSFASSTSMMGAKLTGLGIAMAAPLGDGIRKFAEYDDAIRQVGAITGATGAAFDRLNAKAKQLGATTSFSAVEVANLMTELGRAGFDPRQIEDMTGSVMNLARATGTDATLASGIFAAAIRQFNMEAGQAPRVADALTAAANKSFNSVESLGEALKYAGPVAADANMSLEETLAILGTLGNVGIQGSSAGNALKRLLTLSAAESEKFQKVFGVATKDAAGNARPLVDVLGEVAEATKDLGSSDRAAKFNEVFGMLGITAASAIGKTVTDTRELLGELEGAGGIAKKTADKMESGLGGAFRVLASSFEAVRIAIGEALEKPIQRLTENVSLAASSITDWIGENKRVVQVAAMVAAGVIAAGAALLTIGSAAAAASVAVGGLLGIFSAIGSVVGMAGAAVAALLSPIGLVVAGVAGLGLYLAKTSGLLSRVSAFFKTAFAQIAVDSQAAFKAIAASLASGDITGAAKVMWAYLRGLWKQGVAALADAWDQLSSSLDGFAGGLLSAVGSLLRSTLAWASENRTAILTAVAGFAAMKVAATGVGAAMIALKGITLGLSVASKTLAATWAVLKTVGAGIKAVFIGLAAVKKINIALAGVYAAVTAGLSGAFGLLTGAISAAAGAMALLFSPLGLVVAGVVALGAYFLYTSGAIGSSIDFLKGAFQNLKADTMAAFGAIANALRAGDINAAVDVLWSYIKLQWTKGTTWLSGMWSRFTAYLSDAWGDAVYKLADQLMQGFGGLRAIWNSTVAYLADGWTILTSAVQKGWNNTVGFLKKGFLKLHELVDIAGDVAIQIGGVLVNALAGVEGAWVETIDYLADSWAVFVGEVRKMWNSTVGFLRKAWVKLKSLFDDDINVEAEVRKIDNETNANNAEEQRKRQTAIAGRADKRRKRKSEIEANRKVMQEDLQRQLDQRKKSREGQDLDADFAAIDAETDQQNAAVDAERDRQFDSNAKANGQRTADTEEFTAGVRDTLDEMRRQAKADAAAKRAERSLAEADRQTKVAEAEADFQAAVDKANALKPEGDEQTTDTETKSPQISDDLAAAIAEARASLEAAQADAGITGEDSAGDERLEKLKAGIAAMEAKAAAITDQAGNDGKLKLPPAELDDDSVALELDRDAKASIDNFAGTDVGEQSSESVTGKFDSRGLNIGSGARKLEPIGLDAPAEKLKPEPLDDEPEVILAPKLVIDDQPDDAIAQQEPNAEAIADSGLRQINDRLVAIGQYLMKSNELLAGGSGNLSESGERSGLGLSEDVQRAIVETANNTRKLAERSTGGGLVFS
ncbi:Phage-related minor tail protein [Rubripirellula obstinata]|uniref:Phage-related minor tail protein n=1 Tax=Rubripirellula obstinata TaxID=406547 RepID=A0A5B1CEI5_9BACT|nr:phage tail tape measure protein [Rubripirellula obstinata]KAA1258275.1 Phage-related minor tail protein [Rubripirellula obstinata]